MFHGRHVVPLIKTRGDGKIVTLYVAAQGSPLVFGGSTSKPGTPLSMETTLEETLVCAVSPPPPELVIDGEEFERQLDAIES